MTVAAQDKGFGHQFNSESKSLMACKNSLEEAYLKMEDAQHFLHETKAVVLRATVISIKKQLYAAIEEANSLSCAAEEKYSENN